MLGSLPVARLNPHHSLLLLLPLDCLCAAVAPPCPRHPATRGAGRQPATKTTRRRPEASFPNAQPILRGLVYPLLNCAIRKKSFKVCNWTN